MSQSLPARPNLEHLKNQAKDRLPELQQRAPQSTLADALHAVAQEYGFKTWPELKAHVEGMAETPASPAAPPSPPGGGRISATGDPLPSHGFGRYNTSAKRALFFARYEAAELGSPSIEPEHLLLGIMNGPEGVTSRLFANAQMLLGEAREKVAARTTVREKLPQTTVVLFHQLVIEAFLYAIEEADRLQQQEVDSAHLLLALLRQGGSIAASILEQKGMRLETTRRDYLELLKGAR